MSSERNGHLSELSGETGLGSYSAGRRLRNRKNELPRGWAPQTGTLTHELMAPLRGSALLQIDQHEKAGAASAQETLQTSCPQRKNGASCGHMPEQVDPRATARLSGQAAGWVEAAGTE